MTSAADRAPHETEGVGRRGGQELAGGAAVGLLTASVAGVAVLHLLRPELEPAGHRLSEYASGPHAWIMALAFFALGLGLLALAAAVRAPPSSPRGVALLLAAAGIGMMVSGVFPTDPDAGTAAEIVHSRASGMATVALLVSAAWHALHGRRRSAGRTGRVLAGLAIVLGVASPVLHDSSLTGLSQRLLWTALLGWLLVTAVQRRRGTA